MKKTNKIPASAIKLIAAIINALMFLYCLLFMHGFAFKEITIAIAVVASLIVGQIWYFILDFLFKVYQSHDRFKLSYFVPSSKLGYSLIFIHLAVFAIGFISASSQSLEGIWLWVAVEVMDFPLLHWFHIFLHLTKSAAISGTIVYGLVGTLFWYLVYLSAREHRNDS